MVFDAILAAYVVWWVSDDHVPTWEEAWERLEHLNDNGPSPYAFDYSQTTDDGQAVQLRRNIIHDRAKSVLSYDYSNYLANAKKDKALPILRIV